MARIVQLCLFGLYLLLTAPAFAREYRETWSTDPFVASARRWCVHFNDAVWHLNLAGRPTSRLRGQNTIIPPTLLAPLPGALTTRGCAGYTETAGLEINLSMNPDGGYGGWGVRTVAPLDGEWRTAQVKFSLAGHMSQALNDHLALFSTWHSHCHAGLQTILRPASATNPPTYLLGALQTDSQEFGLDDSNCASNGGVYAQDGGSSASPFSLSVVGTPIGTPPIKYILNQRLRPNPWNNAVLFMESWLDQVNSDMSLSTIAMLASVFTASKPPWYNKQANFGLVGGQKAPGSGRGPVWVGSMLIEAHDNAMVVPLAAENKLWIAPTGYTAPLIGPVGRGTSTTPSWHITQTSFPSGAAFTSTPSTSNFNTADWSIATANNASGLPHQKFLYLNRTSSLLPWHPFPASLEMHLDTTDATVFGGDSYSGCGEYVQGLEAQGSNDLAADFPATFLPTSSYSPTLVNTANLPTLDKIGSLTAAIDFTPLSVGVGTRSCIGNAAYFAVTLVLETPATGSANRLYYRLKFYDSRFPGGFTDSAAMWSGAGEVVRGKAEWTVQDKVGSFTGGKYPGPEDSPYSNFTSSMIPLAKSQLYRLDIYDNLISYIKSPGVTGLDTDISHWRPVGIKYEQVAIGSARVKSRVSSVNVYHSIN